MWPPGFGEPPRFSLPEGENWSVTRTVHCPICGPGSHSYSARDLSTPRWHLLMKSVCPTCGAKFVILKVVLSWHDGKDIRTHVRDFRPQIDLTLRQLAWMVRQATGDPRPLSRLLYYLDVSHPDEVDRVEIEVMTETAIPPRTWRAAWDHLKVLRNEIGARLWPQQGG